MKISILGTEYTITKKAFESDPDFTKKNIDGYCDPFLHQIVIGDLSTFPEWKNEEKERILVQEQASLRHEIVHAFLDESGLDCCALHFDDAWSKNEEMVDWIALMGPRIFKAWHEAGAFPTRV